MPIYQFRCPDSHEFEALVSVSKAVYKWCKHCNALTERIEIREPHSQYYKEKVCVQCMGNELVPPSVPSSGPKDEEVITRPCPECGKEAVHILCVEQRAGENAMNPLPSVAFRFNYTEPTN